MIFYRELGSFTFHILFCLSALFLHYLNPGDSVLRVFYSLLVIVYISFFIGYQYINESFISEFSAVKVLLSVALSLALLMIFGFISNSVLPLFGVSDPIRFETQFILINIIYLFSLVIKYNNGSLSKVIDYSSIKAIRISEYKELGLLFFCAIFPIIGWHFQELGSIRPFSIALIGLICLLAIVSLRRINSRIICVYIFLVSIGLLYNQSLVSDLIFGYDVHFEYFTAHQVLENHLWIPSLYEIGTNQMLSSTILPTYYVNLAAVNLTAFLKFIYPLIFALVPVGLFEVFSRISNKTYALIGVYFFIFQITFFAEMTMLLKQGIAELFFVAVILCIFILPQYNSYKKYLVPIFFFGIIVSHYGFAFIFLLYLLLYFAVSRIFLTKETQEHGYFSNSFIIIFILMLFAYLIYIASSPLKSLVEIPLRIVEVFQSSLFGGLSPLGSESRDPAITSLLDITNQVVQMSTIRYINAMIVRITYLLIILGSVSLLVGAFRDKKYVNKNFIVFILVSLFLLLLSIVLPFFSQGLNMTRTYHIASFFLAITIPYGIKAIADALPQARNINKIVKIASISLVILFFVFQTGLVSLVFNENNSVVVSERIDNPATFYGAYTHEAEMYGAEWISKNRDTLIASLTLSSDMTASQHVLTSYGDLLHPEAKYYSGSKAGYLYLRYLNIKYKIMPTIYNNIYIPRPLENGLITNNNLVYNNGYSNNLIFR